MTHLEDALELVRDILDIKPYAKDRYLLKQKSNWLKSDYTCDPWSLQVWDSLDSNPENLIQNYNSELLKLQKIFISNIPEVYDETSNLTPIPEASDYLFQTGIKDTPYPEPWNNSILKSIATLEEITSNTVIAIEEYNELVGQYNGIVASIIKDEEAIELINNDMRTAEEDRKKQEKDVEEKYQKKIEKNVLKANQIYYDWEEKAAQMDKKEKKDKNEIKNKRKSQDFKRRQLEAKHQLVLQKQEEIEPLMTNIGNAIGYLVKLNSANLICARASFTDDVPNYFSHLVDFMDDTTESLDGFVNKLSTNGSLNKLSEQMDTYIASVVASFIDLKTVFEAYINLDTRELEKRLNEVQNSNFDLDFSTLLVLNKTYLADFKSYNSLVEMHSLYLADFAKSSDQYPKSIHLPTASEFINKLDNIEDDLKNMTEDKINVLYFPLIVVTCLANSAFSFMDKQSRTTIQKHLTCMAAQTLEDGGYLNLESVSNELRNVDIGSVLNLNLVYSSEMARIIDATNEYISHMIRFAGTLHPEYSSLVDECKL